MSRAAIAVGFVTIGAVVFWAIFARDAADRDLAAELASVNAVIDLRVDDVSQVSLSDELDLGGEISDTATFLLYDVDLGSADVASIDDEEAEQLSGDVRYYRVLAELGGLEGIVGDAGRVILLSEIRLQNPAGAPPRTFRVVALDGDGRAFDSDWHGTSAEAPFLRLAAAIESGGIEWAEGLAALIRAERNEVLGLEVDPLGRQLLDAVDGNS